PTAGFSSAVQHGSPPRRSRPGRSSSACFRSPACRRLYAPTTARRLPPAFWGLSKRLGWWSKRGIRHQRLAPGRPEQHGAHERLPRTLKAAATRPPETLASRTLASLYRPSPRPRPTKLPAPAYPGHSRMRRGSHAGMFRVQTRQRFISDTLLQEEIAWEET